MSLNLRTVVILGPDGCGKSTIVEKVLGDISYKMPYMSVKRFHLRPDLLPRIADLPHPSRWFKK